MKNCAKQRSENITSKMPNELPENVIAEIVEMRINGATSKAIAEK